MYEAIDNLDIGTRVGMGMGMIKQRRQKTKPLRVESIIGQSLMAV